MEGAAARNAFSKALKYLAQAEQIDGVHPQVRRARLRLMAGGILRHIQQKKPHLAMASWTPWRRCPRRNRETGRPSWQPCDF